MAVLYDLGSSATHKADSQRQDKASSQAELLLQIAGRISRIIIADRRQNYYCSPFYILCLVMRSPVQVCHGHGEKLISVCGVQQQNLVDDPVTLADPDSHFIHCSGFNTHYKICKPHAQDDVDKSFSPVLLLHGFGASEFSWHKVMKPLADTLGSSVLAFDRPAFGLTARLPYHNCHSNPYSLAFSVDMTVSFIHASEAPQAVLIGHSSGCLVALNAYLQAPERIAALVLVAPTVVAHLGFLPPKLHTNSITASFMKAMTAVSCSELGIMLTRFLVDKFGKRAIAYAWCDPDKLTHHVIEGYTKPLRCKGWERALIEFTLATMNESSCVSHEQLRSIICPVLVIGGDTDRVVPSWNAEALAKVISHSSFEMIQNCGHIPHEEKPEEFVALVQDFLQSKV